MQIVLFLLIFGVIVTAHEFGHFLLAKANGITVVEFAVGMGPALFKFTKGGTKYVLRLLPIGGACMFEGDDGLYEKKGDKGEQIGAFPNAKVGARIATVIAGPLFNFILAFILSLFMVGSIGSDKPVLGDVMEGYPAEAAGMQSGDKIISMNGEKVYLYREVSLVSMMNEGENITIVYKRNGEKIKTIITPKYDEETDRFYIGFQGFGTYEKGNAIDIIKNAYFEVRYTIKMTYKSLFMLIKGQASVKELSGPVGIAQIVGEVYEEAASVSFKAIVLNMLNIAILLSANIGVVNLLPLPALDGGRLVFMIIELFRGKPISAEKEGMVHFVGFVLLMLLMVFVMYNDISRLFVK
ncbi:MAG TPA: RIP metalloprotease RseP [Lachnospiraceae bacterium]|nr:RIP metalloprotease RseP [Lachnospiraceae bacterium]